MKRWGMPATSRSFPPLTTKVAEVRVLTGVLGKVVTTISPDRDLTILALSSLIFDMANEASDPDLSHRTAHSLRTLAALLEESVG